VYKTLFENKEPKLLLIVIVSLSFLAVGLNDAYAVVPIVTSADVTGPNEITIVFSIAVNSTTTDYTDLNLNQGGARNILTDIGNNTNTHVLTFDGAGVFVDETGTIDMGAGIIEDGGTDTLAPLNNFPLGDGQVRSLPGHFACRSDCTPPTLGVLDGKRFVNGGIAVNGQEFDVEGFYQHVDLQTLVLGKTNAIKLKIFENSGPEAVSHVSMTVVKKGDWFTDGIFYVTLDRSWNGIETTTVHDPDGYLEDVRVTSGTVGSFLNLYFNFKVTKGIPPVVLVFNMWDNERNSWQNYFNEGIQVLGPLKTESVLEEQIPVMKKADPLTMHGIDRNNNMFESYMQEQSLLAEQKALEIVSGKPNPSLMFQNIMLPEPETSFYKVHNQYFYNNIACFPNPDGKMLFLLSVDRLACQ